ncbi:fe2+ transport protein [Halobacteriales archaeon QS_8_69_26]|nr:MAG: fe2+ transport protein [Halobacteriales archaeon QS_8_69_26]
MHRRRLLRIGAAAGAAGVAGCLDGSGGDDGTGSEEGTTPDGTGEPTTGGATTEDRDAPDGVYVQPFVETMVNAGTAREGDLAFAVFWTTPHVFWTMTGADRSRHSKDDEDAVHLMATVWDPETGTVLPEVGLSVELTREDDLVSEEVIYPMLSQRMGFHWGANFPLPGDGTYTASVSVSGMGIDRTGAFAGRFGDPVTAGIEFEFTPENRERVGTEEVAGAGDPGAVQPMEMGDLPDSRLPAPGDLPGTVAGTARSDDADMVVTRLSPAEADRFTDGTGYLAVSARTRYNDLVLPIMGLSATVDRDGETVFDGTLSRTLDPDLGYHYGAPVGSLSAGDEVTLSVGTPPQVGRHEGYETAFLEMPDVTVTL